MSSRQSRLLEVAAAASRTLDRPRAAISNPNSPPGRCKQQPPPGAPCQLLIHGRHLVQQLASEHRIKGQEGAPRILGLALPLCRLAHEAQQRL